MFHSPGYAVFAYLKAHVVEVICDLRAAIGPLMLFVDGLDMDIQAPILRRHAGANCSNRYETPKVFGTSPQHSRKCGVCL